MAKFFGYNGIVGCIGFNDKEITPEMEGQPLTKDFLSEALLNNPLDEGQMGFVLDMNKCLFNQEALDILKDVPKGNDDISEVDAFQADDGVKVIAWLGGPVCALRKGVEGSNSYDNSLFDDIVATELDIPEDFKEFVDSLSEEKSDNNIDEEDSEVCDEVCDEDSETEVKEDRENNEK